MKRPASIRSPAYKLPGRERLPPDEAARFPLILVTGDREKSYHHSRFRDQPWALKVSPDPRLTMHPDTARTMGLPDGAWVHLEVAAATANAGCGELSEPRRPTWSTRAWAVAADRPGLRARRARRQYQRRARLRRPWDPVSGSSVSAACRAGWLQWRRDLDAQSPARAPQMQRHPREGAALSGEPIAGGPTSRC